MDSMKEFINEFLLWNKSYSWGAIFIGKDGPFGFLILYGIVKDGKCFWHTIHSTVTDLKVAVSGVEILAMEIERDPDKYIVKPSKPAGACPVHCNCRCTIEPTE